jgi:glycerol-3-phosphate acyltransferase PlsX
MRIVLDAMGSDNFPHPDVEGAVVAAGEYGVEVTLVGDESRVRPVLDAHRADGLPVTLVHAPETLTMEDKGLALALKAMAPALPTRTGSCIVLDIGANPDCKPVHLLQFAIMGSVYAERARGVKSPRIGLLSNGEEAGKGNELVRNTYHLLKESGLNFVGNVEGKELFAGAADVVVTDGFTGNVLLKSSEAVAKLIMDTIREKIRNGSWAAKLGGMLVKPTLQSLRAMLDPSHEGAAPLLGVNGLVFIGHGRSDAFAIKNAIRVAKQAVEANVLSSMRDEIMRRAPEVTHESSS